MSYTNTHDYPLKDYKSGQVFQPGETFSGKGVHPATLKSWAKRGLVEEVKGGKR